MRRQGEFATGCPSRGELASLAVCAVSPLSGRCISGGSVMKRSVWVVFLGLALSLGCSGKKDGDKKDGDKEGPPSGKADFALKSTEFGTEFKGAGSQEARKKYLNKTVDLTGVFKKFSIGAEPMMWLEGAKGELL